LILNEYNLPNLQFNDLSYYLLKYELLNRFQKNLHSNLCNLVLEKMTILLNILDWCNVFEDFFENWIADIYLKHCPYACVLASNFWTKLLHMFKNELVALKEYIKENLIKSFIWNLKFIIGGLIVFFFKKRWNYLNIHLIIRVRIALR